MGRRPTTGGEVPESLKQILALQGEIPPSVLADARAAYLERVERADVAACSNDRVIDTDGGGVRVMTFTHVRVTVNVAVIPANGGAVVRGAVEPSAPVGIDVVTPSGAVPVDRDDAMFSTQALDHGVVRVSVHVAHPPARIHTDWFAV